MYQIVSTWSDGSRYIYGERKYENPGFFLDSDSRGSLRILFSSKSDAYSKAEALQLRRRAGSRGLLSVEEAPEQAPTPAPKPLVVVVGNAVDGLTFYRTDDSDFDSDHPQLKGRPWVLVKLQDLED